MYNIIIIHNLSKNPQKLKDTFLRKTTISNLVDLNFEKFLKKKSHLNIKIEVSQEEDEPLINFSDEIMYGLGNIIQNATEHAKNKIDVNISWDKEYVFISVKDDGKGFTKEVLDNVGSPFISRKNTENSMGLGIFIAKNLIENIGGNIKFYNKTDNFGSVVEILLKKNI